MVKAGTWKYILNIENILVMIFWVILIYFSESVSMNQFKGLIAYLTKCLATMFFVKIYVIKYCY